MPVPATPTPDDAAAPAGAERGVRAGFALAIVILIAIGFVSYEVVTRLNRTSLLVVRSHTVISHIDSLVATTFETESTQRAYVITGEDVFATEHHQSATRVEVLLEELQRAVGGDPGQQAQFEPLAAVVRERMQRSQEIVELRRHSGIEAVQQRLARSDARPGVALQSEIRRRAFEMKAAEESRLVEREREAQLSARQAQGVIIVGSILALACVAIALLANRRQSAGRARAEADLNRFFDLSLDLFAIASKDGYFKRLSPAITDMLGYSIEEALKIPFMEFVHPDDQERVREAVRQQMTEGAHVEEFWVRYRHKDGQWRMLSWRSIPRGELMFATARDITEKIRVHDELTGAKQELERRVADRTRALEEANESLGRSERRFRALIENGADSIALVDANNRILYLSPAVKNVEGYEPAELMGSLGTELTHPDDLPVLEQAMRELLANPGRPVPATWRRRHKDGRWIWLEGIATNLLGDPSVGAIVCNYRDITDRLAHERRLAEQLQRLAMLSRVTRAIGERQDVRSIFQVVVRTLEDELSLAMCAVCFYDAFEHQLNITCIGARSEAAAQKAGLTHDAILPIDENGLGRCVRGQLVHEPDIRDSAFDFPRRLAAAGMGSLVIAPLLVESRVFGVLICARQEAQAFSSGECEFLRQVSEHIALASHQAQLYAALQQAYDDLRQSQQQVLQQERLRALGQMASGIAHDINNAISPMSLYTEALLEHEAGISARGRKQLEIIQRAIDDVAQTVARMGEFYRTREPEGALTPLDLNLLIEQVVDLTRARWSDMAQQRGAAIDLELELDPALPRVAGVQSQIRDALVNLVFNAVDAMPQGGKLRLRTACLNEGAGNSARVEVIDSGVGMDEDVRRRCLEPFFTTKGARGTGLGLPMVYGVAQRHAARLEISSAPGKGTTVQLDFAAAPTSTAARPETGNLRPPPTRILIVDDDPLLLNSLRDALETDGHEVLAAQGGREGINAFVESKADGRPFPVVITDLGMPHVDGRAVAAAVKHSAPTTIVLLLTGWGRRLVVEGELPEGVDEILSKPPRVSELRATLVAHLGRASGHP